MKQLRYLSIIIFFSLGFLKANAVPYGSTVTLNAYSNSVVACSWISTPPGYSAGTPNPNVLSQYWLTATQSGNFSYYCWDGARDVPASTYLYVEAASPDLTAESLSAAGWNITTGGSMNFNFVTRNNGPGDSGWATNMIRVTGPGYDLTQNNSAPPLGVGGAAWGTSELTFTFPTAGSYSVYACADKDWYGGGGFIAETNEGNNCTAAQIMTVTDPAPSLPDLTAESLSAAGWSINTGGSMNFNFVTRNNGPGNSPAATNMIRVTGPNGYDQTKNNSVGGLGAGGTSWGGSELTFTFPTAGTYYVYACADKDWHGGGGFIAETNEGNNCTASQAMTVNDVAQPITGQCATQNPSPGSGNYPYPGSGGNPCAGGTLGTNNMVGNDYHWYCDGVNGGAQSGLCWYSPPPSQPTTIGTCSTMGAGPGNGNYPENGCNSGTLGINNPQPGGGYHWYCNGQNGGATSDLCWYWPPSGTNGQCNYSQAYGCTQGSAINHWSDGSNYTWNCQGTNGGGTSDMCYYSVPPSVITGVCGTWPHSCNSGDPINLGSSANQFNWYCQGSGGGGNSGTCTAPRTWTQYCTGPSDPDNGQYAHWEEWEYDNTYGQFRSTRPTGRSCDPTPVISSNPTVTPQGSASTITWSSPNPTWVNNCTAYGHWNGAKGASGSESTGALNNIQTYWYHIYCSNAYGSSNTVSAQVQAVTPTYSDLTAGYTITNPNVSTVNVGSSHQFIVAIFNNGQYSTNSSFNSLFQVNTGPDGTGSASDIGAVNTPAIPPGGAEVIGRNHIFYSPGVYSLRTCADKSSAGDAGSITESNENNNCGAWTNITVACPAGQVFVNGGCVNQTWTQYCTGPNDPNGNYWQVWAYDNSSPTNYRNEGANCNPTPTLTAASTSIPWNTSTTLNWSSANTSSCTASDGWSGTKGSSGSQSTGNITTSQTYTIICTNNYGQNSSPVSVTVNTCSNRASNPTACTVCPAGQVFVNGICNTQVWTEYCTGPNDVNGNNWQVWSYDNATPENYRNENRSCNPTPNLSANPINLSWGESSTLTWSSSNSVGCLVSGGWNGGKAPNGSESTGALSSTQNYNMYCINSYNQNSGTVTATVNVCPFATPTWTGTGCVPVNGDILPNTCTIPNGQGTCSMNVVWSTSNAPGVVEVRRNYDNGSVLAVGPSGNSARVFPYSATPFLLDLYDAHRNVLLDSAEYTASCATGGWDSLNSQCASPAVVSVTISGQYYSTPGTLRLVCSDSDRYQVRNADTGVIVASGMYNGPVNIPVVSSGNYALICLHGDLASPQVVRYYNAPPPPEPIVSLVASPRTIARDGQTTLRWEVQFPVNACTFTARAVCINGNCSEEQTQGAQTMTTRLRTENTDLTDPNGSRSITSSIRTIAPGRLDTDWKALGKKSMKFSNTMDITLDCGNGKKATTRVQVTSSEEQ